MNRRTAATAAAALAALAAVGACTSDDNPSSDADTTNATTARSSDPTTAPPSSEPIDLGQIPDDTSLEPGTYSVALLSNDGPMRAIVDVPEGYVAGFGGTVIAAESGDIAFWGKVTKVNTDPCLGGKEVSAGTSVDDLASRLAAVRHMRTTKPTPVTIGGYDGVALTLTAPTDIDRCQDGLVTIYGTGDSWLQLDVPSATFHEYILDVNGQRVVAASRMLPDADNEAEVIDMLTSATFTDDTGQE